MYGNLTPSNIKQPNLKLIKLWWLYKRFEVQSPPTPKTDWYLGLMIKELSLGVDAMGWNFLKKKKKKKANKVQFGQKWIFVTKHALCTQPPSILKTQINPLIGPKNEYNDDQWAEHLVRMENYYN